MVKRLTFFLVLGLSVLQAAPDSKEIKYKSRDLEKVKSELSQKKEEQQRLAKEQEALRAAVRETESKLKSVETSLLYTKQKDREIEMRMATAKNQHDKLLTNIEGQTGDLKNSFRKYYVASLMAGPTDPEIVFSRQMIHAQGAQLRHTSRASEIAETDLRSLIDTHQAVRGEVQKQENKLSSIRAGQEDKEKLLNKKKSRQEALEAEVRELQQTAEQLASLIDVLRSKAKEEVASEKEARRIKQLVGPAPIQPRSLPWPLIGKITTRFGRQQHPTLATTFVSNGIVITSPESQDVLAVADGKVLYAGEFMSYGPMTVVEHPGDWYTVYGQMSKWDVEKGQAVKKGELIGHSRGKAGGGYEAYFELRFYGKSIDPTPWLVRQE